MSHDNTSTSEAPNFGCARLMHLQQQSKACATDHNDHHFGNAHDFDRSFHSTCLKALSECNVGGPSLHPQFKHRAKMLGAFAEPSVYMFCHPTPKYIPGESVFGLITKFVSFWRVSGCQLVKLRNEHIGDRETQPLHFHLYSSS